MVRVASGSDILIFRSIIFYLKVYVGLVVTDVNRISNAAVRNLLAKTEGALLEFVTWKVFSGLAKQHKSGFVIFVLSITAYLKEVHGSTNGVAIVSFDFLVL